MNRFPFPDKLLPRILVRVLPVTIISLFAIWLIASALIRSTLETEIEKKLDYEALHSSLALAARLETVLHMAKVLAKNDLIFNSLFDAEGRVNYVPVLFRTLRVPDASSARISLTDYRGRIIASNKTGPSYENAPWLSETAKGLEFLKITETGLTLSVPVLHGGLGEGAIVIEYGAKDLQELFTIPMAVVSSYTVTTETGTVIQTSNFEFAIPGQQAPDSPNWITQISSVDGFPQIRIAVAEKEAIAFAPLKKLRMYLLFIIVVSIAATVAGNIAAAVMTTRPVSRFVKSIRHIRETGDLKHRMEPGGSVEFRTFALAFNDMLDRLQSTLVSLDIVAESNGALKREISARRQAEQDLAAQAAELRRSNTELEQFAYVASHDLKAPLRAIDSIATWIEEDLESVIDEQTRDNLGLMRGRISRMENLLTDLLDYSRVGRTAEKIDIVDTGQLVKNVFAMLGASNGFTLQCTTPMPTFMTACVPLERIFHNLIGNALKHHDRDSGAVTIATELGEEFYVFTVTDDGPGIDQEYHERIFKMFQTLRPRDEVEGSGMGLALVRKIIENNGGTIRIENTPGTRGSSFVFSWPKEWKGQGDSKAAA